MTTTGCLSEHRSANRTVVPRRRIIIYLLIYYISLSLSLSLSLYIYIYILFYAYMYVCICTYICIYIYRINTRYVCIPGIITIVSVVSMLVNMYVHPHTLIHFTRRPRCVEIDARCMSWTCRWTSGSNFWCSKACERLCT